ncbi:tRNA (guanine-N1)-methyltransferase [Stetteria hydrogenophila]
MQVLKEKGLHNLGVKVWLQKRRVERLGFQHVAVEMLVKGYSVVEGAFRGYRSVWEEEFGGEKFRILMGRGEEEADSLLVDEASGPVAVSPGEVEERLPDPPFPLFVVDLVLKHLHTEEELSSLRVQISVALSTLREYLWDRHLVITSVDAQTSQWLAEAFGYHKVMITRARPNEVLWDVGAERVYILRPDAPRDLTREELMTADAFLIGGIVDKIPRKGVSRVLDNLVPWGVARRISLRGSVIGVPERINRIIEILLKARYVYQGDLEKAIISTMTKKDVYARLYVEVNRAARKVGKSRVVDWGLYHRLRKWLPISEEDFVTVCRKAGVEIAG